MLPYICTALILLSHFAARWLLERNDFYSNQPADIKMSIMANPILGKEFFELVSLVISSINGCEMCVSSHERSVLRHGSSESRVMEGVKLGRS